MSHVVLIISCAAVPVGKGDPVHRGFFLSLEDNLMRIFASERVKNLMQALGMEKGEAIEHRMVSNAIEKAQPQGGKSIT